MQIAQKLRVPLEGLISLLFPPHCSCCRRTVTGREVLCASCRLAAERLKPPFCEVCSRAFDGAITGPFVCANCEGRHFHFTSAVAPYRSRGVVRELIHRLKYDRQYHLRHPLAAWLADALDDPRIARIDYAGFVPVPLHPTRSRWRGFNQAEVLAGMLSERTGRPLIHCLERTRATVTQTRLDREDRMENLRNAFRLRHTAQVQGMHLLLVDDVLTTGCTADECARVLIAAGAASVRVIVVARG